MPKKNQSILKKVSDALKHIADRVMQFFKGNREMAAHNAQAQAFIDDHQALERMATLYSKMFDEARENERKFGGRESGTKYKINEQFYDEFDAWDGNDTNQTFIIGNTSEALQSVGVKNNSIVMRSGMIAQKIKKHSEMTRDIFRQIPKLLENPVIVQFSDAIDKNTEKSKYDSRITILGELYANIDGNNVPILVSVELLPTNQQKTRILDLSVITSAYGHSRLQRYLNENSILYIDPNKKRTNNWLSLNRLQLPLGENQYGSIRRITYTDGKVKIQNSIHMTQMQEKMFKAGLIDEFGNSRKSKDDTIYDSSEIEDLFDDYEDSSNDSGDDKPVDVKNLFRHMLPDEAIFRLSDRIGQRAVEAIRSPGAEWVRRRIRQIYWKQWKKI